MTMIEWMARAIYEGESQHFSGVASFEGIDDAGREQYREMARAALGAMKKPTQAMVNAALSADGWWFSGQFAAAIQAALDEEQR